MTIGRRNWNLAKSLPRGNFCGTETLQERWSFPLRISSVNLMKPHLHLPKNSLMENFIFCPVKVVFKIKQTTFEYQKGTLAFTYDWPFHTFQIPGGLSVKQTSGKMQQRDIECFIFAWWRNPRNYSEICISTQYC